jgi:5-formyltetrahydrofolate cyclo-ligase
VLAARDAISPFTRSAASKIIAKKIATMPSFIKAKTVLLFYPFGSEWDASLLIDIALAAKKRVALPRTLLNEKRLELHSVEVIDRDTEPGPLGIREPLATRPAVPAVALDWILAPGVAFTRNGDRLGHGAGFFDRLLTQILPTIPVIAGAFEIQIVPSIPMEAHDRRVTAVVTEKIV